MGKAWQMPNYLTDTANTLELLSQQVNEMGKAWQMPNYLTDMATALELLFQTLELLSQHVHERGKWLWCCLTKA